MKEENFRYTIEDNSNTEDKSYLSKPTTTIFAPNMDYKYIPILNERGEMHRIPTEDLFQSVKILNNAIGDDTFTKQVVARPDGTLGVVNIKRKKRIALERDITITNNGTTTIDELSVNLEAGKVYKITSNIAVQKSANVLLIGLTEDQNTPLGSDRFTLKYDFNSRYMNKVDRYTLSNNGELYFLTNAVDITENNVVIFISGLSYPTANGIIRIRLSLTNGEAKIFKGSFLEIEEL